MKSIAQWLLFLFVITLGLELGAALYEALNVVPIWRPDPQASYLFFHEHLQFAMHPGERWWIFATPLNTLIALAMVIFAGRLPAVQRSLVRGAALGAVIIFFATYAWYVPTLILLQNAGVLQLPSAAAQAKAQLWSEMNWLRAAVGITCLATLVYAAVFRSERVARV